MSLKEEITKQIAAAAKTGDKLRLSTLRLLLAAVTNREIELKRKELTEEDGHKVAATLIRQRKDSIEQFRKGGREDLARKEEEELEILKEFVPPELTPEEIKKVIKKVVEETGATGMQEMGKVMKVVMAELKGRADGRTVQEMVKKVLGGS